MTDETHPSYPNPTIVEALCEIGFEAQPSRLAGDFVRVWPQFSDDFSSLEVHTDVLTAPRGPLVAALIPEVRTRFSARRTRRPVTVQFLPGAFAVSTLAPYLGWETFRGDIESGWTAVQLEWGLPRVNHVLVRYINQVSLPAGVVSAEGWLKPGPFLAQAEAVGSFQSQVQTGTGTADLTLVMVQHQPGIQVGGGLLTVDIERSLRGDFAADPAAVLGQIEALHKDIWQVFAGLKGPRWDAVLEGRPQEEIAQQEVVQEGTSE